MLGAGTDNYGDAQPCDIIGGHAYIMIAAFELTDSDGNVADSVYMLRNPWDITSYDSSMDWHYTDSKWTDDYISQVPNGIDPTIAYEDGIFFVDKSDF